VNYEEHFEDVREERCNLNFVVLAIPTYLREHKHKAAAKEKNKFIFQRYNFKKQLRDVKTDTVR